MDERSLPEWWNNNLADFGDNASPAIQSAIDATGVVALTGKYRCDEQINICENGVVIEGTGNPMRCQVKYNLPGAGTLFHVQATNPANLIQYITLDKFGIVATYPHAHKKTAIKIIDGSLITIGAEFPDWSWTGDDSVGLHFNGRDQHIIRSRIITADQPIRVSKNPNSDQYQFDVYRLRESAFQTLNPANHSVLIDSGVNISQSSFRDVMTLMGKGGIKHHNTDANVHASSQFIIDNWRFECGQASGGQSGGFAVDLDFGSAYCANVAIRHSSANDPTCNGYRVNSAINVEVAHTNAGFASGNVALELTNVKASHLDMLGIGDDAAIVNLGGQQFVAAAVYAHTSPGSKSTFFGYYSKA